jgi:hypothetical protein
MKIKCLHLKIPETQFLYFIIFVQQIPNCWTYIIKFYKMHGACINIIYAQQAKMSISYKNMTLKLLKKKDAIRYYNVFKEKQLTPKYIYIKVNESNMQSKKLCICWTYIIKKLQNARFIYQDYSSCS